MIAVCLYNVSVEASWWACTPDRKDYNRALQIVRAVKSCLDAVKPEEKDYNWLRRFELICASETLVSMFSSTFDTLYRVTFGVRLDWVFCNNT